MKKDLENFYNIIVMPVTAFFLLTVSKISISKYITFSILFFLIAGVLLKFIIKIKDICEEDDDELLFCCIKNKIVSHTNKLITVSVIVLFQFLGVLYFGEQNSILMEDCNLFMLGIVDDIHTKKIIPVALIYLSFILLEFMSIKKIENFINGHNKKVQSIQHETHNFYFYFVTYTSLIVSFTILFYITTIS